MASSSNKAPFYLLRDAKGEPSVSVTISLISFWITSVVFILSIFVSIGPIKLRAFDPVACGAFLGPCLGLYGFRKHTDANATNVAGTVTSTTTDPPAQTTTTVEID